MEAFHESVRTERGADEEEKAAHRNTAQQLQHQDDISAIPASTSSLSRLMVFSGGKEF